VDPIADPTPFLRGLYHLIPPDRIAHILDATGRQSRRVRRIPADAAARLVVALGLFADLPVPQVWRRLHPGTDDPDPVSSAFCQARDRLGVPPLRRLFEEVARPMGTHQTVGASYRGWRLMGLDGTTLDLPDTPDNARVFGRPATARAAGAFPQLRLLALCELGTRAICGLSIKPGRRGEQVMAGPLVDRLGPGMLLVWDRGFFGYPLAERVLRTGAHLLARVPAHAVLTPTRRLPDGSYLAALYPSPAARAAGRRGLEVRVIEYTHDDPGRPGCGARTRLLTDLLSPDDLPAADAPVVYHERWEQELAFDELKTHLSGRDVPVRSKTPAGVVQEVYGLVLAYYLVRRVIRDAAATASVDPDRVSFAGTLRVLWCRLPEAPGRPPVDWYQELLREVRRQRLGPRRDRWYPRVIKRKMSNWGKKRAEHLHPPQPTKPFREAARVLI
jgi:transposase IS4-like protein/DDE family transposase